MLLGDVIARFEDETLAAETLLSLDDLALTARVTEAAADHDLTAGEFATMAVDHFVSHASNEDWLTVIGQMSRANDPGQVFLRRALMSALAGQPRTQ
jgi:hypothetical protein